jgi:hypothetical protein
MVFRISPLIKVTLILLLVALTLPLPFLKGSSPSLVASTIVGMIGGLVLIYLALDDRVIIDEQGIELRSSLPFRKGWQLPWSDIVALKPKTTGQGGLVYYFLSRAGAGYLLPMRVAGFSRMVKLIQERTNLDMQDVKPLAQPWMYLTLLLFSLLLLLCDVWVITTALGKP